jgi:hypothetical protein
MMQEPGLFWTGVFLDHSAWWNGENSLKLSRLTGFRPVSTPASVSLVHMSLPWVRDIPGVLTCASVHVYEAEDRKRCCQIHGEEAPVGLCLSSSLLVTFLPLQTDHHSLVNGRKNRAHRSLQGKLICVHRQTPGPSHSDGINLWAYCLNLTLQWLHLCCSSTRYW